ncbi:MAG: polysaccharide biosynthesis tyrosine autokinase [Proteobacteria bacterium]|nr:polysaccharide biosynthesis tyrosine autokinase [Pseudomonadota bacterium]
MPDTPSKDSQSSVFPVREYLDILWRRRWGVILAFVIVVGLGALYTLHQPKIYEAVTAVIINPEPAAITPLDASATEQWFIRDTYYDTQLKVMQSRYVAQRVVDDLGLASNIEFLGLKDVHDPALVAKRMASIDPVSRLLGMLKVEAVIGTRLVNIRVKNQNPDLAAMLADAIAKAYSKQNSEHRLLTLNNTFDFIDKQYKENEVKLQEARDALNAFKENHKILYSNPIEQQKITNQRLDYLNNKRVEIETQRLHAGYVLSELKKIPLKIENVRAFDVVVDNASLESSVSECHALEREEQKLLMTYLEKSPQVVSLRTQINACQASIIKKMENGLRGMEARYLALEKLDNDLNAQIKSVQNEALELDQLRILYEQFESQRQEQERLFELSEKKLNEVSLNRLLDIDNIRILDTAKASRVPVSPNLLINGMITLLAALIAGLLVGFLLELLDISVRTQADIEERARLPFLGAVPKFPKNREYSGQKAYRFVIENPRSPISESVRTLRTTLSFLLKGDTSHVLLITSAQPLEGKTMTSINLAVTSALAGQRVVLVEADLRRPRIYNVFKLAPERGMSAVINGESELEDVLIDTGVEGLKLLPCGTIPKNPAELFSTAQFEQLLGKLRSQFDLVVIDSPPITVVTDALIIAQYVHGVIVIARANKTPLPVLIRTRELLEGVNAPILGTVLNDMSSSSKGYYGGYYYYHKYYTNSYNDE